MSKIAYDPVKDRFADVIKNSRFLRTVFYKLLDLFFLRGWYVRSVIRRYAAALDKKGPWKMLDAGSGFGQYDRFLLSEFEKINIDAVDVKEDYLQECRQYFEDEERITYAQADLLELEGEPEYDFSICIDVLEHIEDDVRVMTNLRKVLKKGGYFLMHSPSHLAEEDAGDDEFFVDEHARAGYSKAELQQKLEKAGLRVVEMEYSYGVMGHAAWVLLIKNPMLWFTKWGLAASPLVALYYVLALLPGLLLMRLDMIGSNEKGTGIYALAVKPIQ